MVDQLRGGVGLGERGVKHSQLLRCCTAKGFSAWFNLVGPSKVKALNSFIGINKVVTKMVTECLKMTKSAYL